MFFSFVCPDVSVGIKVFDVCILICAIGKISGLYEKIILLNRSSRECTADLSEIPSSLPRMMGYLQSSGGSKFSEIAGYRCYPIPDPNLNEFNLYRDEWRYIYYDLRGPSPQERIVIKTNGEEVWAIYLSDVST